MGVNDLSKKLRDSSVTPDEIASDVRLSGKRLGVDFMVVAHKAIGSYDGAAEMAMEPEIASSTMKESARQKRQEARQKYLDIVTEFEGRTIPPSQLKEAKAFVKNMAYVSDKIVAVGVEVFRDHGHEVYGTCFESDFQLVYWEKKGFTAGTLTIDSDIYAMGSKLTIDLVNYNSAKGKCKILVRSEVQKKIMVGSENWSQYDTLIYCALCGCDFIPRLFKVPAKNITQFMIQWKDPANTQSLNDMLDSFSQGWHWPGGNGKPGALAVDYRKRVLACVGLMMHGPVISKDYEIVPLNELPAGKSWVETIGR
ncbi:hypothetical protein THAOC_36628 [Thalassiosira oceanica]|uniref:Exonuclease 1 n=1 Tax=Thalassiosira oceanica TaxID=159749 RepID=K0RE67_THAOC|nr:hypothetical protein THAOC_36628 [Thalassiosira oceanica]|eukprot:EJK44802.1 hypothetical protein THAOC_36628 [Thalassiosira oceanica]